MHYSLIFLVYYLKVYGFIIRPYDPCVDYMEINGSQMTVVWHVENLKVSHKDSFIYLTDIYGGLKVNCGKVQNYLGMDLYYYEEVFLNLSMIKYLKMYHLNYLTFG